MKAYDVSYRISRGFFGTIRAICIGTADVVTGSYTGARDAITNKPSATSPYPKADVHVEDSTKEITKKS